MDLFKTLGALDHTKLAEWVQADPLAFPGLEAVHVISVMLVFGSVAMLDLRLLGVSSRNQAVVKISDEVLPWTWVSFLIAVISGCLLFIGQATAYLGNQEFKIKMVLMAVAGINLAIFHVFTWSKVQSWNNGVPTPVGAKVAALLSLTLWAGVVIAGRWIGWTLTAF
jgi:uncharacterized membrane protein